MEKQLMEKVKLFKNSNGEVVCDSLQLANSFANGKHSDVIRKIRSLEVSEDFRQQHFKAVNYINIQNKTLEKFELTKDGFMMLVMHYQGFTALKEQYIQEYNAMEKFIQEDNEMLRLFNERMKSRNLHCEMFRNENISEHRQMNICKQINKLCCFFSENHILLKKEDAYKFDQKHIDLYMKFQKMFNSDIDFAVRKQDKSILDNMFSSICRELKTTDEEVNAFCNSDEVLKNTALHVLNFDIEQEIVWREKLTNGSAWSRDGIYKGDKLQLEYQDIIKRARKRNLI